MNLFNFLPLFGMTGDQGGGDGNLPIMPQWAANLPAEITGNEVARNILMQHKDGDQKIEVPTTLIKSYIDSKRAVSGMVKLPAENATPADIAVFNKKIGVPDSPEGYEFKIPEGSPEGFFQDEQLKAFKGDVHELGIPKAKAEVLFERFAGRQIQMYKGILSDNQKTLQERIDGLKTEFGSEYSSTIQVADKAVHFADPAIIEVLEKAGLLGHPAIVKGFAKIGKALGEGVLKGVDTGVPSVKVTREEVEGWMRDPKYKLPQGDPVGQAWRKKVELGFEQLYPGTGMIDTNPSSGRAMHG